MSEGTLVGFGGILPALCAAFGMYHVLLGALTTPIKTIKIHSAEIVSFLLGGGVGFLGLSKVAHLILSFNKV